MGQFWLGASQYGSEIGAGEGVGSQDKGEGASKGLNWSKDNEDKAVLLLATNACRKYLKMCVQSKVEVECCQAGSMDKREGLVVALPHVVVNLGNGSTMLGSEVVFVLIRRIILVR